MGHENHIQYEGHGNHLANKIRNVFQCFLSCSICMQNFIEFELTITELCSVLYSMNTLTQLVTSRFVLNQQFIFCKFLKIT